MSESPGDTWGTPPSFPTARFDLQRLIGEGSRKRVFLAHDKRLDRPVAIAFIKTQGLDQIALDRVHREAREMGRLGDHPNIVSVYDIGEADGQLYIVTQFMSGGDVKRLLDASDAHRVPTTRAIEIADQVCSALEHAHAHGVVHRDVKPENVWLSENGVAHLGDFGLALDREGARLTSEGTIVGTFAYMAPEQALGREPEARSDLYAVGAMLYEMVTGRPPFVGDDPVVVVSQHINTAPVAPSWHNPEVPSDLEALILQLLAKALGERPLNAAVVRGALAAIARTPRGPVTQHERGANPARLTGNVFVGRAQEMEALRTDIVQTLAGRGRLVLLGGEPGIGKTSVAQEVATYAGLAGVQVLWGRCDETGGAPPYWPWVQMIRSYAHDLSVASVASVMGSGIADIAQVVPEVAGDLPQTSPRPPVEPDQARFRLFDSIATFLRNAGRQQPLLLIVDDLHAADTPSLRLLQFLARQIADMHVMVVAAYRDVEVGREHLLFQVLGEIVREPVTRRVTLRGLDEHDVGRCIELSASTPALPTLAAAVFRETEGNPFFLGEVVRLLVTEGRLASAHIGGIWRSELPQSVREVIARRLDRLSPECNRVLALGSVVGREFDVNVLGHASDTPRDALLQALEEALAARVVAKIPAVAGRYSFLHVLFRETLYGELGTTQRIELHRQVGEALEGIYRLRPEPHLAELAHHFFEAAQGGDVEKAFDYAIRAADRATAQMAHEEAVRHYEMALQVLEGTDSSTGPRVIDLLLMLSEASWRAGEVDKAKEASLRAIDVARDIGAGEPLARAALGLAGRLPTFGAVERDEIVIALLEESLKILGDRDSAVLALVMARLAEEHTLTEFHERRWALSRQAVEMARRIGDPRVLASVLACTYFAHWDPLGLDERLEVSDEIVRLADQLRDRTLGLEGHMFRFLGRIELGDSPGAQQELEFCEGAVKELRQPYYEFIVALLRGCLAFMQGRLGDVERLAREALLLGERARAPNGPIQCGVQLHRLMWLQGRFEELEPLVLRVIAAYPLVDASNRAALALTYAEQGRLEEARVQFDIAASHDFVDIPRHLAWQFTVSHLAEACAVLGDVPRAERLYELLRPLNGRILLLPSVVALGPAAYYLGRLATVLGRWEQAAGHFEDALRLDARTGARQQQARAQVAYAEMLVHRGQVGDRLRALELLKTATLAASDLGMARVVERARELTAKVAGEGPAAEQTEPLEAQREDDARVGETGERVVLFRREGEYWTIAERDSILRLKDMKGLHYLTHLLRSPTREFRALDLISTTAEVGSAPKDPREGRIERGAPGALDLTGPGAQLDETAKARYRNRLVALREELEEAERFNDSGRADALRSEVEALTEQLAGALGLGGRDRSSGSSSERARSTVTKGIKSAMRKIGASNPRLGRYLASHVRTGYLCSYTPDADRPIRWRF